MSEAATPTQIEAMESTTDTKNVKVDMVGGPTGLPTHSKLAHVLAVLVSGAIALAVATVLADGTSVIKLKPAAELPTITDPSLASQGIKYRADELLGPTYGIGLHHDQSGRTWTEIGAGSTVKDLVKNLGIPVIAAALPGVIDTDALKHPVPLLSCDDLQMAGLAAMSLGMIAEAVAVVMVLFHALALAGLLPAKIVKPFAGLIWFVLTAGFLTVIMIAYGVYTATWKCDNVIIPTLELYKHFDYSYGFGFAIVGYVSALLIFVVTLTVTSMKDGTGEATGSPSIIKLLGGLVVGLVVGAVLAVAVAASNDAWKAKPAVDASVNPCEGQKPYHFGPGDNYFKNSQCIKDGITQTLEQAGGNVTKGFKGLLDAGDRVPITKEYSEAGLCPVNVHWHLGAEHLSVGEYDEKGTGPANPQANDAPNPAEATKLYKSDHTVRRGFQCRHYDSSKEMFKPNYEWKYCKEMLVGETYEVHWPHSAAGACGTDWQMQTPFYDGVFCKDGVISIAPLNTYEKIGVQSQVFTIVNDEKYYYPDLIKGAYVADGKWKDVAKYTGSTTGTSRDNSICSRYSPITWQVDRKCHLISASSFDKMCKDMKAIKDDMTDDLHAHGARWVVSKEMTSNNQQSRK